MVITVSTVTRRISRAGSLALNSPTSPVSPAAPTATFFPKQDTSTASTSQNTLVPKEGDHSFHPPIDGIGSRSPCPALNALANHGYLPRDGRGITFHKIVDSLEKGFGLSHGFALFMAVGTFTLLRRSYSKPFDLAGTNLHNFIEHNASLAHDDVPDFWQYGRNQINPERLQEFLDKAHPTTTSNGEDVFTSADIASHRIALEKKAPLHAFYSEIGRAEIAMVMEIFGNGKDREVTENVVKVFLEENRFPDGWKPTHTLHLKEAMARSKEIRHLMATMRKAMETAQRETDQHHGILAHVIDQLIKLVGKTEERQ